MLDLICHPYSKKLLVLLPKHMSNVQVAAEQCANALSRFCRDDDFRVLVCEGNGHIPRLERDSKLVEEVVRELNSDLQT